MSRRKRTDRNQAEIMNKLRQIGCSVHDCSDVGNGFPDIVVGWKGKNYLFEVKDGLKYKSQRKLTNHQIEFHQSWKGSVHKVESFDDCLEVLKC